MKLVFQIYASYIEQEIERRSWKKNFSDDVDASDTDGRGPDPDVKLVVQWKKPSYELELLRRG